MSRSVAAAAGLTHANSRSEKLDHLRAGSSLARMGTNRADIREIVLDTMAEMRLSQKEFAINAKCPASDLSNALQDKQRLDAQWLFDQETTFVLRVWNEYRRRKGIGDDAPEALREAKVARVLELTRLLLDIAV